jgi:hypothetical protein
LAAGWLSLLLQDNIWNHGEFDKITVAHCDILSSSPWIQTYMQFPQKLNSSTQSIDSE